MAIEHQPAGYLTCRTCGESFGAPSALEEHLRAHEGIDEEALVCPRCSAVFGSEEDLRDHLQSHVTNSPTAGYICTACGAAFESEEALVAHADDHMVRDEAA
jgi:KRAB domain-containing zinc finger protein